MIKRIVSPGVLAVNLALFLMIDLCHASEILNFDFKWMECSEIIQCEKIKDACQQDVTVNKESVNDAKKYYEGIKPIIKCESITTLDLGKTEAACVDGGCRLMPVKAQE